MEMVVGSVGPSTAYSSSSMITNLVRTAADHVVNKMGVK